MNFLMPSAFRQDILRRRFAKFHSRPKIESIISQGRGDPRAMFPPDEAQVAVRCMDYAAQARQNHGQHSSDYIFTAYPVK